jgi:hypothetical protein
MRSKIIYGLALVAAAVILAGPPIFTWLFPQPTHYASEVEHFKYGSVGVEAASGVPYEVWRTLPGVCMNPAQAAAGYHAFGFQWEPGRATPIGMPVERAIVPRVGVNCAMCYVGRVETPTGPRLLVGAPNTTLDLQAYLRFLLGCASSKAFNADAILAENRRLGGKLNPIEQALYRVVIIPQVQSELLKQKRQLAFMDQQPDWGPGRSAGFQPAKVQILKMPFDGTLDIVDIPPLWNMRMKDGGGLHWDGVNTSIEEVFLNSAIGNGATGSTVNRVNVERMEHWVHDLAPAAYPWPVDRSLAAAGKGVFASSCAQCHAPGAAKLNQVVPINWTGTDRNRLDAFTDDTLAGFLGSRAQPWRYTHFRKTDGYVAGPLDGIWARAPYLHNGSVPTLAALLQPPADRPVIFRRGSTDYDTGAVGFKSDQGWTYDTRLPGNSNAGHTWGAGLSDADRRALLEYLKTL